MNSEIWLWLWIIVKNLFVLKKKMSRKITTTVIFTEGEFKNPYLDVEDYIIGIYGKKKNHLNFCYIIFFLSFKYSLHSHTWHKKKHSNILMKIVFDFWADPNFDKNILFSDSFLNQSVPKIFSKIK